MIAQRIKQATAAYFISPHLDDAVFSAGGLMASIAKKIPVKVINIFTTAGSSKNSLSAKAFLSQIGELDASKLFADRLKEDSVAVSFLNAKVENWSYIDALWRNKNIPLVNSFPLQEFSRIYPTYRYHIIKGKIKKADEPLIASLAEKLKELNQSATTLFFCPLGFGNHVDHLVVREACLRAIPTSQIVFWADFPYIVRSNADTTFFNTNTFTEESIKINKIQKIKACKLYISQFSKVIKDDNQIPSIENFYQLAQNNFPEKLGHFSFKKSFQAEDDMSNYSFAIYQNDEGKEYFAKRYHGPKNTRSYQFLLNEINVYKLLNKNQNTEDIKAPQLVWVQESASDLFMVIEFIKGTTLREISPKAKVEVFEKVIAFFAAQNLKSISGKSPIIYRGPAYWMAILLLSTLQVFFKNPQLRAITLKSFFKALIGLPSLLSRTQRGLIHRDFNDHNVLVKNGKMYPIDFQLTSVADPLIERAILYLKYYHDPKMITEITSTKAAKIIAADKKQSLVLRTYQIIFALYDQCLPDGDHLTTANFLTNLVNNKI